MTPDEKLDALLESQPIQVDARFTEETLRSIRKQSSRDATQARAETPNAQSWKTRPIFWLSTVAAGLLVLIGGTLLNPFSSSESPALDVPKIALERPSEPKAPAASMAPTLEALSEAEFYALEDTLSDLDILLEEDNLQLLYLLTADLTS